MRLIYITQGYIQGNGRHSGKALKVLRGPILIQSVAPSSSGHHFKT